MAFTRCEIPMELFLLMAFVRMPSVAWLAWLWCLRWHYERTSFRMINAWFIVRLFFRMLPGLLPQKSFDSWHLLWELFLADQLKGPKVGKTDVKIFWREKADGGILYYVVFASLLNEILSVLSSSYWRGFQPLGFNFLRAETFVRCNFWSNWTLTAELTVWSMIRQIICAGITFVSTFIN